MLTTRTVLNTRTNNPSLDFNFTTGVLDSRITFTRASTATYYDATGTLKTAGNNVPRFDYGPTPGGVTNLVPQSGAMAAWTPSSLARTAGAATDPSGATGGALYVPNTFNTGHFTINGISSASGVAYTFSVYAKAAGYSVVSLCSYDGSADHGIAYNLSTQAVTSNRHNNLTGFGIQAVGNGWYRIWLTYTTAGNTADFQVGVWPDGTSTNWDAMGAGNGTSGAYVWGAQAEVGSVANTYVPTTNGPANIGAIPIGLLCEEQRTNLVLNSGDASNASWVKSNAVVPGPTVTGNQIAAPDGTITAAKVVYPAVTGTGAYSLLTPLNNQNMTAAAYSFAVWLKGNAGGETLYLTISPDGVTYYRKQVTLTTAWQRFTITTGNLTTAGWYFGIGADLRDTGGEAATSAQTIYVWGAQVELGSFATSYIPTTTSTVTRAADNATFLAGSWYGSGATPSWVAEATVMNPASSSYPRIIGSMLAANETPIYINPSYKAGISDGAQVVSANAGAPNRQMKIGTTWQNSTATVVLNSGTPATGAESTGFTSLANTTLRLMGDNQTVETASGWLSRVRYWPRALSTLELQAATSLLTNPALDFSFMAGVLDPNITFTRASVATYFDVNGTLQTAGNNVPRFEYDPVLHTPNGLLVESQRTNLALQSSAMANAAWINDATTNVTGSATTDPSGGGNGALYAPNTSTTVHYVYQPITITANTSYTASCFVKSAGNTYGAVGIISPSVVNYGAVAFDLVNMTATAVRGNSNTTLGPATIQQLSNGWYRVAINCILDSSTTSAALMVWSTPTPFTSNPTYAGDGISGTYVWGAQLELGNVPTSYIPTTTTAVTRADDWPSISTAGWYNTTAQSVIVEASKNYLPDSGTAMLAGFDANNGSQSNRMYLYFQPNTSAVYWGEAGPVGYDGDFLAGQYFTYGTVFKAGFSVQQPTGVTTAFNGVIGSTNSGLTHYPGANLARLNIGDGDYTTGDRRLNGYIRRLTYWPRVISSNELTAATLVTTPSIDFNFLTGVLDPQITFTRASIATYYDATGTLKTAGNNVARFDYDPVTLTLKGLLNEEQRTNLVLNSGDASNASWQKTTNISGAPTVTGNQIAAPDGTLTAAKVVYPTVTGTNAWSVLLPAGPTASAAVYSMSVWLKGSVGGETIWLNATPDGATYYRKQVTLTTSWQRFTLVTGTLTAAIWYFQIGTDLRDASQTATIAQTIYVWGAQVELGSFPTSYIPTTTAAATRAADNATFLAGSWYGSGATPSWVADVTLIDTGNHFPRIVGNSAGTGAGMLYIDSTYHGGIYDGVTSTTVLNAGAANRQMKIGSTWQNGTGTVVSNAGTSASASMPTGFTGFANSTLYLMGDGHTATDTANGWLSRVRYWPRVLSTLELQAATFPTIPTIDFNLLSSVLDPQITFSRPSVGTYFDYTGTLKTASNNVPRFDYDPVTLTLKGLLIEEQRTNSNPNSNNFTLGGSAWITHGGDNGATTVTANAGTAPDGTNNAWLLNNTGAQTIAGFGIYAVSGMSNTIGTISLWMKAGSVSTAQLYVSGQNSDGSLGGGVVTLTNQWQRFSFTASSTDALGYRLQISTNGQAGNILIFGAQLEAGTFATSYITTTGSAVTRSADSATFAVSSWYYGGTTPSWAADVIVSNPAPNYTRVIGQASGSPGPLFIDSSYHAGTYDSNTSITSSNTGAINTLMKLGSTWQNGSGAVLLNGGTPTTGAMPTGFTSLANTSIKLMGDNYVADTTTGWIQRARYWPRALPISELQTVTTLTTPTLDFNFLTGVLDPKITFTRASVATYYDATGTLRTAANNVARIDYGPTPGGVTNWIINGQCVGASGSTTPSGWQAQQGYGGLTPGNYTSIIDEQGYGGFTYQISGTTTSTNRMLISATYTRINVTPGTTYTLQYGFKVVAGSYSDSAFITALWYDASGTLLLVSGGTGHSTGLTTYGRYSDTFTAPANAASVNLRTDTSTIVATGTVVNFTIQLSGVQFEVGTTASAYVPTYGAAANSGAVPLGLLIEEQRTNLQYPSVPAGANWVATGSATATATAASSPDGTTSAVSIFASDTSNGVRALNGTNSMACSGSTAYAVSVYVKSSTNNAYIQVNSAVSGTTWTSAAVAYFNLSNGTGLVGADQLAGFTNKSVSISSIGNGWYRATLMLTTPSNATQMQMYVGPCVTVAATGDCRYYTGVVGQGIYVWGAQGEAGTVPTSYIPTTTATVTRADDWPSILTGSWYNTSAQSLVVEASKNYFPDSGSAMLAGFDANNGTQNGRMYMYFPPNSSTISWGEQNSGVFDGDFVVGTYYSRGTVLKAGFAAQSNNVTTVLNGVLGSTSALAHYTGSNIARLNIGDGDYTTGGRRLNGYIRRLTYWPRVLSNAELRAATLPTTPTIDFNFLSGALDPQITFTRASSATYFDSNGTLQTAGNNVARFDYDPSTLALKGLLNEEQRTNLVYPSVPTNWTIYGPTTVTAAATSSPDGTTSGVSLFASDTTNAARQIYDGTNIVASANTAYAVSVYFKSSTNNAYLQVNAFNGGTTIASSVGYFNLSTGTGLVGADLIAGATNKSVSISSVGNSWYRAVLYLTTPASIDHLQMYIGPCVTVSSTGDNRVYTGVVGQGVYVWGAQAEAGTFATSYIPTTTASATRAADSATFAVGDWYLGGNTPSWAAEFIVSDPAPNYKRIIGSVSGAFSMPSVTPAFHIDMYDGVGNPVTTNGGAVNTVMKAAASWQSGKGSVVLNGGSIATASMPNGFTSVTGVKLMGDGLGDTANGWIRRARYWPRALSKSEIQTVTT